MSKRSTRKKQSAKKMRKLNKRRLKNRRKLNEQQDANKQAPSQGQIHSQESPDTKETDKEKFDFEELFIFVMSVLVVALFIGMMGFFVYVLCFEHPDSTEQENPSISVSEVSPQDKEDTEVPKPDRDTSKGSEELDTSDAKPNEPDSTETAAPTSNEDSTQSLPNLEANYLFYDVTEHATEDLIAVASTLEFHQGGWPEGYDWRLYKNPDVKLPSNDPLEISLFYADLYNKDEWTGFPVERDGMRISYDRRHRMEINDELTGVQTNDGFYYDIAEELYLRGVWDGSPMTLGSHTVSLGDWGGTLLVDGYLISNLQECVDLPLDFDYGINRNYFYKLGKGAYVISNQKLVRYLRREPITVPGGSLDFSKLDLDNGRIIYCCSLLYSEVWDKLFLVVYTCPEEYAGAESEAAFWDAEGEPKQFLYIFPDYNVSKVKFVSEIKDSGHWGSGDDAVYFIDTNDVCFRYGESGFYKTDNPFE